LALLLPLLGLRSLILVLLDFLGVWINLESFAPIILLDGALLQLLLLVLAIFALTIVIDLVLGVVLSERLDDAVLNVFLLGLGLAILLLISLSLVVLVHHVSASLGAWLLDARFNGQIHGLLVVQMLDMSWLSLYDYLLLMV
jgi:hypothetical protein